MGLIRDLKVALASRRLFRNWLSAGFKYLLIKHGLSGGFITVECGDSEYRLSPKLYSFIVNAYYDGYVSGFGCNGLMEAVLGDAIRLTVNRSGDALLITPDGTRLYADHLDLIVLSETWLFDVHFLGFDLSDWLVVDVGAYVGDTPLYFAKRGAFVIAVKPVPSHFEAMLRNIELNPGLSLGSYQSMPRLRIGMATWRLGWVVRLMVRRQCLRAALGGLGLNHSP
ncbi:hypothetical protein [Vulcanisaeta sp. JCM 16161]|uniref:hypothetical protein n=1 Tax=Vulcanisaeta sp. JCM 16161 TaxID=1295372 RepID=UPI0006D10D6C|nr:hypothetical protein [Vulcanisaeta sp. JCM 16161]